MTRAATLAVLLVAAGGVAGCASDSPEAPAAADAASAGDVAGEVSDGVTLRGEVVALTAQGAALRVRHEAVPNLGMEAMTMDFALDAPALGEGLAPGDKVALTLQAAPRLRITAVRPLPPGTALVLADAPPDTVRADTARAATP